MRRAGQRAPLRGGHCGFWRLVRQTDEFHPTPNTKPLAMSLKVLTNAMSLDILAPRLVLRHCAAATVLAVRAGAHAWLARIHVFWIGFTMPLPAGGLAACWLLERADFEAWMLYSTERWLRLASVALVFALHAVVLVVLYLESCIDDPAADADIGQPTGIPPPH